MFNPIYIHYNLSIPFLLYLKIIFNFYDVKTTTTIFFYFYFHKSRLGLNFGLQHPRTTADLLLRPHPLPTFSKNFKWAFF